MSKVKINKKDLLQKEIDGFLKKGKCLELVIVYMDSSILSLKTSQQFIDKFQSLKGPQYEVKSDSPLEGNLPNIIKWVTKCQKVVPFQDSWRIDVSYVVDEIRLMIICGSDFVDLINDCYTGPNNIKSISDLISSIKKSQLKVSIILYDIDFELLKIKKKQSKRKVEPLKIEEITSEYIDSVLLDLQIDHNITTWKVSGMSEAGEIASCYTKSVAEKEFKSQLSNKTNDLFSFTISKDVCCRISADCGSDRFGGVDLLWRRQLTHFSGVKDEMVNAIVTLYPTPRALYEVMMSTKESHGENAAIEKIANVEVRRGTELLTTSRKVGKEIAKRIYEFITSQCDGNANIY